MNHSKNCSAADFQVELATDTGSREPRIRGQSPDVALCSLVNGRFSLLPNPGHSFLEVFQEFGYCASVSTDMAGYFLNREARIPQAFDGFLFPVC